MAIDAAKEGLGSPAVILVGNAIGEAVDWVANNGTGALTVDEHTAFNEWQDITEAVQHAA
jgi:uroporphyrin-III C-methyltransferase